ncbi:hypothetical protein M595_4814 [Lyngbya aestuarii BL J]|uniref:Uncharacterized protein n=1 Tax=Lyngbya aestuarii BL J TaxID=1348334 RepID=U7QFN1_9CYAN|nr:hypothetical protein M595_4814 [Lyngbya aestuarii BL J]
MLITPGFLEKPGICLLSHPFNDKTSGALSRHYEFDGDPKTFKSVK